MDPVVYAGFVVIVLCAVVLLIAAFMSRQQRKRDDAKIHAALKPHEQTTLHLSDVTDIPVGRVHMAVDRLETTHGVRSRLVAGGMSRNYHSSRMVSLPQTTIIQPTTVIVEDSGPSLMDVVIAESLISSQPAYDPAPTFQGFGGGSSGGGGASSDWGSSPTGDGGDGGSCGDGGGGDGGGGDGG